MPPAALLPLSMDLTSLPQSALQPLSMALTSLHPFLNFPATFVHIAFAKNKIFFFVFHCLGWGQQNHHFIVTLPCFFQYSILFRQLPSLGVSFSLALALSFLINKKIFPYPFPRST
jgi:hypothetical protein